MKQLSKEESQAILVSLVRETAKMWLMRGLKLGFLGFLGGLTLGWIAGGEGDAMAPIDQPQCILIDKR
jgi:hypothetical protein